MDTPSQPRKIPGQLFILLAAFCWSFAGVIIKFLPWNAFAIAGCRSLLAIFVLLPFMRKNKLTLTKHTIGGALAMFGTMILFIAANKYTTAANAIVLQYVAPVFVVILSLVFLKKRPTRLDVLALTLTLGGMVLFFLDKLDSGGLLGNLLAICSGLAFAFIYFINSLPGSNPLAATLMGHILTALVFTPFFFTGNNPVTPVTVTAILLLGIVQVGLGYAFFSLGVKSTPPLDGMLISMLEPLLNPLWVLLLLKERPGPYALLGAAIILLTVMGWNVLKLRLAVRK